MPLYEYQCEKCGDLFEVMQKFTDEPVKVHEKCGGPVVRLLSAPAFQFKGSGWYITDYAKSGGSASDKGKSDKAPANGKSEVAASSTKSDSSTSTGTTSSSTSDQK